MTRPKCSPHSKFICLAAITLADHDPVEQRVLARQQGRGDTKLWPDWPPEVVLFAGGAFLSLLTGLQGRP